MESLLILGLDGLALLQVKHQMEMSSCEGGGDWDWYDNLATPQGSLRRFFFFDGDFVTEGGTGDNNPVDNYGDFNAQDCDLEVLFLLWLQILV